MDEKNLSNRQRNLKLVRRLRGLTQEQVDEALGLKMGRTRSYERGLAQPPDGFLQKVAKLFNIGDWRLFDAEDILSTVTSAEMVYVPYWGAVPCGDWEAPSSDVEYVPVTAKVKDLRDVVAVRIMGESMLPLLAPGQIVPVKLTSKPADGVVSLVRNQHNDLTIKVAKHAGGQWEFHATNPRFKPAEAERIEMVGRIIQVPERFDSDGIAA